MKRALILGLVMALAVGAWFVLGRGIARERGEAGGERLDAEVSGPEERELTPSLPTVQDAPASARVELGAWDEAELARATWIEGRVLFPPGTPADERAFVRAMGKEFARGGRHRAAVAADGSFRVAFAEGSKAGKLRLEARYLYLEQLAPWKTKTGEPVTLAPRLGGRIEGRVVWPQGSAPDESGRVFAAESLFGERSCALTPDSRFAFGALDPAEPRTLRYEGARHLAQSEPVTIVAGTTISIELEARAGVVLAGSVHDDAGKPVAKALVALQGQSDWNSTSAADGSFRLVVDPGPCSLWVSARDHEERTVDLGNLVVGADRSGIEVLLSRGGVVAGRVQWPDGTPAHGAVVSITQMRGEFFEGNGSALSTAEGSFEVAGLGQGPFRLYAQAIHPSAEDAKRTTDTPRAGVAEILDVPAGARDLLVELSLGHEIAGIVRTEGPALLLGFQLAAQRQKRGFDPNERPLEKSFEGAGGHFSMGGFLPGDWELSCRAPGFAEASQSFTVPSASPIELVLTPGAALAGRVLDERGGPVERAKVALDDGRFSAFFLHGTDELVTGPDGAFSFKELRAGSHELTVEKPGFVAIEEDIELLGGEVRSDHDVILRRGSTIEGRVLGIDGQPSPKAYVYLYGTGHGFPPGARAGPNGNFRFDGVPPGDLRLEVALADGLRFESRVHVDPAATVRVELSPPRTGWVTLAGRATVAGKPSPGLQLSARVLGEREASSSGESDSTGSFRLVLPGPGTYRLDLEDFDGTFSWSEDLVVPPVEEFPHDIEAPAATIRGRVTTRDGVSLRNIRVQAESGDGSMDYSCSGDTDERGLYEFLVAPGRWSVFAGGPSTSSDDPHGFARARRDGLLLRAGETLEDVDLVLAPGASLSVRLARADGAPVADGTLLGFDGSAWDALGYGGSDGSVSVHGLAAGTLRLEATGERCATRAAAAVTLAEAATSELTLTLHPAVPVELRVRLAGAPAGGLELALTDESGAGRPARAWGDVTDLGPLPAGRYVLRVRSGTHHVERAFEVRGDEPELVLELDLE